MANDLASLQPGQRLQRGVCRHLLDLDFACIEEFVPSKGLRVDVMALGPKGEFWIIECKSSRADFTMDKKWQGYLEWSDRYFWAVDGDFPVELLRHFLADFLHVLVGNTVLKVRGSVVISLPVLGERDIGLQQGDLVVLAEVRPGLHIDRSQPGIRHQL